MEKPGKIAYLGRRTMETKNNGRQKAKEEKDRKEATRVKLLRFLRQKVNLLHYSLGPASLRAGPRFEP